MEAITQKKEQRTPNAESDVEQFVAGCSIRRWRGWGGGGFWADKWTATRLGAALIFLRTKVFRVKWAMAPSVCRKRKRPGKNRVALSGFWKSLRRIFSLAQARRDG